MRRVNVCSILLEGKYGKGRLNTDFRGEKNPKVFVVFRTTNTHFPRKRSTVTILALIAGERMISGRNIAG